MIWNYVLCKLASEQSQWTVAGCIWGRESSFTLPGFPSDGTWNGLSRTLALSRARSCWWISTCCDMASSKLWHEPRCQRENSCATSVELVIACDRLGRICRPGDPIKTSPAILLSNLLILLANQCMQEMPPCYTTMLCWLWLQFQAGHL